MVFSFGVILKFFDLRLFFILQKDTMSAGYQSNCRLFHKGGKRTIRGQDFKRLFLGGGGQTFSGGGGEGGEAKKPCIEQQSSNMY